MEFGIWYPKGKDFTLFSYSNVYWASCIDHIKSTSGIAFYLGDRLVAWHSKNQDYVSLSTTKAEYIATTSCHTQVLWMKQTLKYLGIHFNEPISVMVDNTNVINISKNSIMHFKTKHIDIRYHFLKEKVT